MALQYIVEYKSLRNNDIRVEISDDSYTGSPISLDSSQGDAVKLVSDSSDNPFDSHIVKRSIELSVFSGGIDIDEIVGINDGDKTIRYYKNNELQFQGFVIADGLQEKETGVNYIVNIKGVDGLSMLETEEIRFVNSAKKRPIDIVGAILTGAGYTNNELPIRWSCNLKNKKYPNEDFFAGETKLDFRGEATAYYILENILKSAGCWLEMIGGYWYIISFKDFIKSEGSLTFNQIVMQTGDITSVGNVNLKHLNTSDNFINDDGYYLTTKKISTAEVSYEDTRFENVLPDLNKDWVTEGTVTSEEGVPMNIRNEGHSALLKNDGSGSNISYFKLDSGLTIDTNILFKHFEWGFTFSPRTGFTIAEDSEDKIEWTANDVIEVAVQFRGLNENGNPTNLYLNEFGYWSEGLTNIRATPQQQIGTSIEVLFAGETVATTGRVATGDTFRFETFGVSQREFEYSPPKGLLVPEMVQWLSSKINQEEGVSASYQNNSGYSVLTISGGALLLVGKAEYSNDGSSQEYIPFKVDGMRLLDVATVRFQSKTNEGRPLLPDIGTINESLPSGMGKLYFKVRVREDKVFMLDDFYMFVDDHNDVYEVTNETKNSTENQVLGISSSFSGFMESSYGSSWRDRAENMWFDDGDFEGTLTEIYGAFLVAWKRKSLKQFNGSVNGDLTGYKMAVIHGKRHIILSCSYNADTNISNIKTILAESLDYSNIKSGIPNAGSNVNKSGVSNGGSPGGSGGDCECPERLSDLSDVDNNLNPSGGDALVYDDVSGKWISGGAGYAERAGTADIATTAGHADTADHADYADFAGDSEKWNGLEQPDYIDQPVRKNDEVEFKGVNAKDSLLIPAQTGTESNSLSKDGNYLRIGGNKIWAGRADLWNGLSQPDYLTQPVRPQDTVEFAGVITPEASVTGKLLIPQISDGAGNALWKDGSYLKLGSSKIWAGRADLWNGLQQPDYLTQPVRPADSPIFKGVSSQSFASGFAGHGYRIVEDANGNYIIEADRLIVRKDFNVYELNVEKIRASNGSIWVSDGVKIYDVEPSGNNYKCYIDTDGDTLAVPFKKDDIVRCQVFEGTRLKYYTAEVKSTADDSFTIEVIEGFDFPESGDDVVRIGSRTNANRQGALYLTASDSGAPYIDVIDGVTDASLAGKTKARLGKLDGIVDPDFGALSGYGLYGQNVYLKGNIQVIGGNAATTDQIDNLAGQIEDQEIYVEYSADGVSWHSTFQEGSDVYMRQKKGDGSWTDKIRIVGIAGEDGKDGEGIEIAGSVSSYSALPTNLDQSDAGKAYMNLADGKLYIWDGTAFPPNGQGIEFRGPKGEPGAKTYMWVQYADNAQGGGMSDSSEGKLYIGLAFNKANPTPSNNPADYEWSEMPQNLEIGGRNLLLNTSDEFQTATWRSWNYVVGERIDIKGGEYYTARVYLRPSDYSETIRLFFYNEAGVRTESSNGSIVNAGEEGYSILKVKAPSSAVKVELILRHTANHLEFVSVQYKQAKLEKGNKDTDWSPAPEDVNNAIDTLRTETFTEFAVLDGKIESKVSQTDFNALDQRVGSAETSITQNANEIQQRATKTEVTTQVNTAKSDAISDANSYTDGKVSDVEGDVSSIETRVTTAETNITQNANAISLKADQTQVTQIVGDVNSLESRMSSAELKIEPDAIRATVKSQTEQIAKEAVDGLGLGGRNYVLNSAFVGSIGSSAPDNWQRGTHGSDFEKSEVVESPFGSDVNAYEVIVNGDRAYLEPVPPLYIPVTEGEDITISAFGEGSLLETWIEFLDDDLNMLDRITSAELYLDNGRFVRTFTIDTSGVKFLWFRRIGIGVAGNKVGSAIFERVQVERGNKATDWSPAPEDITNSIDTLRTETFTEFAVLDGKISSKVSQTDFNALDQRVGSAETSITQNADAIELRATKNEIESTLSVSANQISLLSKTISLSGAVTFDSLKSGGDGQSIIDGGYIKANLIDVVSLKAEILTAGSIEVGMLSGDIMQAGKIKSDLIDVQELLAQDVTATGTIMATNLKVTGSSEVGDFTIQNGYLTSVAKNGGVLIQSASGTNRMYAGIGASAADIAIPGTWGGELPAAFGNNRQSFDENIAMYLEAKNGTKNIAVHVASGVARLKGLALGVQNISGQATISKDTVVAFVINANNNTNIYMPSEPETGQLVIVKNLIPNNGGFILQHNLSGGGQFVGIDGNSHGAFQFRSGSRTVRGYVFSGSNWQQIIDA